MSGTTTELSTAIASLADRVRGPVFTPDAAEYDAERTGFQLLGPHRPAVIVGATDARDIRAAVGFAAAHGARVAVQAGGHGLNAALEGGVLIGTRRMSDVRVDPRARTAWVEAGANWQQVIDAAAPHGLAPLAGSSPGVGAVSYTLGGGVGLMARRHGFASDHVRRFDLVTADGHLRRVTPEEEPDLFWALRGGGGNFGVVTGMEIDLVPVNALYGGGLYFDVEQVPGVLESWRRWTADVPEELTSAVSMLPFPDLLVVPEALRGRHVAQIQIAYLGAEEEGARLVEPLRALGPSLRDTLRVLPFSESSKVFDEPDQAHAYRSANLLLPDLDPEALATLPKLAGPSAPVMCVVGIRHLGGALARPPKTASAVGHRDAGYSLGVLSPVAPGEEDLVRATHLEALEPWRGEEIGRSLNFSFGPLDEEQVRSAFAPRDYRRLTELRARHDPHALFHSNHPIPPAGG
ncbi:FAD/FMN-containing dehydrogenase [Saccharopolyspora erythraea NRRL 2338]|uniref:FAD-dependent oxygenase n=2 Tax=Saccharopolyspora erythraea TaxID=1836 RepID=A4FQS6_SACEN|nr:FAD-binding oxidoreductase [Saccharopolyspora erythraea]PFG93003.1 FAD/FMN-containing dehydrogenase [Saccharopolyspora erythraea NRRL 2338]CAM06401.1 FAD-dependent oxygenase [Saccharopolyspora erythraea NRRL 2338]